MKLRFVPRYLLVVCCALSLSLKAHAATYYVATNGDDSRSASQAQNINTPWRTVQKAAWSVVAGDVVYVRGGIYNESVTMQNKSGTSTNYIKFLKYPGDSNPKIQAPTSSRWAFQFSGCSYVEINSFEVTAPNTDGVGLWGEGGHHLRLYYCSAYGCGESGISMKSGDYVDIKGCWSYNNCKTGTYHGSGISLWNMSKFDSGSGYHNTITACNSSYNGEEGNRVHTDGNGIIIDESSNNIGATLISNCTFKNNGGKGVQVYRTSNVTAEYNTVLDNLKDSQIPGGEMSCIGDSSNYRVENSIFRYNTITATGGHAAIYARGASNFQQYNNSLSGSVDIQ